MRFEMRVGRPKGSDVLKRSMRGGEERWAGDRRDPDPVTLRSLPSPDSRESGEGVVKRRSRGRERPRNEDSPSGRDREE